MRLCLYSLFSNYLCLSELELSRDDQTIEKALLYYREVRGGFVLSGKRGGCIAAVNGIIESEVILGPGSGL